MVERIVENLLANAVKHTPGDARIWIRVERTDEGPSSSSRTTGRGSRRRTGTGSSTRSCRGRAQTGGAGWGWRSWRSSPSCTTAGRGWERSGGGASFRVLLAFEPRPEMLLVLPEDPQATGTGSSPEDSQA